MLVNLGSVLSFRLSHSRSFLPWPSSVFASVLQIPGRASLRPCILATLSHSHSYWYSHQHQYLIFLNQWQSVSPSPSSRDHSPSFHRSLHTPSIASHLTPSTRFSSPIPTSPIHHGQSLFRQDGHRALQCSGRRLCAPECHLHFHAIWCGDLPIRLFVFRSHALIMPAE